MLPCGGKLMVVKVRVERLPCAKVMPWAGAGKGSNMGVMLENGMVKRKSRSMDELCIGLLCCEIEGLLTMAEQLGLVAIKDSQHMSGIEEENATIP